MSNSTNKLIVNGIVVEGAPKTVKCEIKKQPIDLTLAYVDEKEKDIVTWTWAPVNGNTDLTATTIKAGNRVATTLKLKDKVIFTNLTAQSVFAVVNIAFGQSVSTTDGIYKRTNPARKEGKNKVGAATVVVEGKGAI